jgi:hypothetical protein
MPSSDERNSLASTQANDLLHLIRRSRQYDDSRLLADVRQGVGFVRQQFQPLAHNAAAATDAFELVQEAFADCCCHCRKSTIIPFPLAGSAAPLR